MTSNLRLAVKKTFWTVQGEGYFTGTPAIFLRLAGCSTNCDWCDTDWKKGQSIPFAQIKETLESLIQKHPYTRYLVISGGEPFDQAKNLLLFLDYIKGMFDQISIETSVPEKISLVTWQTFPPNVAITLSPKLFLDNWEEYFERAYKIHEVLPSELKIVVDSYQNIGSKLRKVAKHLKENQPNAVVRLMIEDSFLLSCQHEGRVEQMLHSLFDMFQPMKDVKISPRLHNQLKIV